MKRSASCLFPSREPSGLTGGASGMGGIPLSTTHLTIGLVWWLLWMAVCGLVVVFAPAPARAQTVAWAPSTAPGAQPASAPGSESAAMQRELETLLRGASDEVSRDVSTSQGARPRVEVVLGQLDPRLKLAPCDKVRAYLPNGARLWGRTRVGLRCEQGPVRWNVYWPLTVKVWAKAVVAVVPLKPGTILTAADLRIAEVDVAESISPAVLDPREIIGRSVIRGVAPGQGLRQDDVRLRRWFAAGDVVRITVKGSGFAATSEGQALAHGDEGQCVRIRVDSGRVLCARPIAERQAEVTL